MNRAQYWLINGASLGVALLIVLEIGSVHQLNDATARAEKAQAPVLQAQQEAPQIERLIQRTALGATRDPALQELLAKYGVTVKPVTGDPAGVAAAASVNAAPVTTASASPP